MGRKPSDVELDAYVDDELDDMGRYTVEAQLADDPQLAARVMGDLSVRTGLRLLSGRNAATPARPEEQPHAAGRGRTRAFWRTAVPIGGAGMAAALVLAFLSASNPPRYVDMAVASHRVAMMRARMVSQIEGPMLDSREILASTSIVLPALPSDWKVTDVQLFPTSGSPALLVAVTTEAGKRLSLFATRQKSDAPVTPDAVREGAQSVAYWRRGEMSYALTGEGDPVSIDRTAESLNRFWS